MEIMFTGVCTHFWDNPAPGVQHRVVLPDATALRTGLLTGPFPQLLNPRDDLNNDPSNPSAWISYALLPHFPSIWMTAPDGSILQPPLSHPGLLEDGRLITPCILSLVDVTRGTIQHEKSFFETIRPLTEFFSSYVPSSEVLTGGRASAYFDLQGGTVQGVTRGAGAACVTVTVESGKSPALLLTPMVDTDLPFSEVTIPLLGNLNIRNDGLACNENSKYDYVLHYLTSVAGIPRALSAATPGMNDDDPCGPPQDALLKLIHETNYPNEIRHPAYMIETSASCSDSRYP
jgi:hypothetical protein